MNARPAPHARRRPALTRRGSLAALLALAGSLGLPSAWAQAKPELLRIGFQKSASLLTLQKSLGSLEKRLVPLGVAVKWVEFPAGPQLLEGLNVGAVDVGFVGEAPPIFAQAAGAKFVYIGFDPAAPEAEAIVVPKDSTLRSVADLKGRKVALNKGSNVHYLLVRALEKAGLKYADIQPVFLPPADARAAFERGAVDAWAIWDPFLAAVEKQSGARILVDGRGLVNNFAYYLAERGYAEKYPQVVQALFEDTLAQGQWLKANLRQAASVIAPLQSLEPEVVERSLQRYQFGVKPLTPAVAAEQQKIADTFHALGLIPRPIQIVDALPAQLALTAATWFGTPARAANDAALPQLRIGFQKGSFNLAVLKSLGLLEQRLPATRLSWVEFPAGPQLLEALAVGSVDFGATGDAPPVFAQAAGKDLFYVGAEPPKPDSSAVLVKPDAPIRSLADLKGRRIALQKGSSAHFLLVQAVRKAGLTWDAIQPVYLPPAEARAAFERGAVDAWVIWDPYYAAAEIDGAVRVLATSRGLTGNNTFYLASRTLAGHEPTLRALFAALTETDAHVRANRKDTAQRYADFAGLGLATVHRVLERRQPSPVGPLTPALVAEQQKVADAFAQLGLIPRPIRVADIVWQPGRTLALAR